MLSSLQYRYVNFWRRSFHESSSALKIKNLPNLIKLQMDSYVRFLSGIGGIESGLSRVISSVFPIDDKRSSIEFISVSVGEPRYTRDECIKLGAVYTVPMRVVLRLIIWDRTVNSVELDDAKNVRSVLDIKEQEVYFGDIPMMTENGTFIINGTEKVVVSQMHRSPGVFFDHDLSKASVLGTMSSYSARIIPYRGAWLDFEFDGKDNIYFRIDKKRKLPVTTLLRALGYSDDEIISSFYDNVVYFRVDESKWKTEFCPEKFNGDRLKFDLINADDNKVVLPSGSRLSKKLAVRLYDKGLKFHLVNIANLSGFFLGDRISEFDLDIGYKINYEFFEKCNEKAIDVVHLLHSSNSITCVSTICDTLVIDKNKSKKKALTEIYKVIRAGEVVVPVDVAESILYSSLFDSDKYDLLEVGRVKMNARLALDEDLNNTVLTKNDIISVIRELIAVADGRGCVDDIDHLGNRRVRCVGEFIENYVRKGLLRLRKSILERIATTANVASMMPYDVINAKPLISAVKDFFLSSQLSQFMDQTNPLSEITHKRRLSALGPGGVSRERVGFEIRDIHYTHSGRICPVETPEGQNIGLISSLAMYARINKHGFIEAPYYRVTDGLVGDNIIYMSAIEDESYVIAPGDIKLDKNNCIIDEFVSCRRAGEFVTCERSEVDLVDFSAQQYLSVAACLIPALEHNEPTRTLMGCNMQRQAVPLIKPEAPFIGTGVEQIVAVGCGSVITANRSGIVDLVDSKKIVIRVADSSNDDECIGVDLYQMYKFSRTNHNTCITQKPFVKVGDVIKKGDIIADGAPTDRGDLSLGRNVLVAFASWNGYNYEDSILVSERLIHDDVFTSIHIEEFECVVRDTRLGPEEITRDIPNVSDDAIMHLDELGIVNLGANVSAGNVLVGKVAPKGDGPVSPEEKLLRAVFGDRATGVRDTSLYTSPGVSGTVIDVQICQRKGLEKDQRCILIEKAEVGSLRKNRDDTIFILSNALYSGLRPLLLGTNILHNSKTCVITEDILNSTHQQEWFNFVFKDEKVVSKVSFLQAQLKNLVSEVEENFKSKMLKMKEGSELLQSGALKVIKVFIAVKRQLQAGDKMSGRHGNKGVVSKVLPIEDMPYLPDGRIVDVVLSPLGVPSRMNVGQILETHLGWSCVNIAKHIGELADKVVINASSVVSETNDKIDSCDDKLLDLGGSETVGFSNVIEVKNSYDSATVGELRKYLLSVYSGSKKIEETLECMDDEALMQSASFLRRGVYFASPAFEGPTEEQMTDLMKLSGVDISGKEWLIDGCTGSRFAEKITVGYLYLLKLHHLVDNKIHSRSVGSYSLVTQQPLGGKAHFGGQRIGEMEVWALEAYGASNVLLEMLTVKSDDTLGRVSAYSSIIKGDQKFDYHLPESFNVLINELKALCINMELHSDSNCSDYV